MVTWFFMFFMVIMTPSIMLIFGFIFSRKAPSDINYIYGYRTKMSMKNKETWEFAHKFCGKLWKSCGAFLLIFSVIVMIFLIKSPTDTIGKVGSAITLIQVSVLVCSIIPTEIALKKNFDSDGNPKK